MPKLSIDLNRTYVGAWFLYICPKELVNSANKTIVSMVVEMVPLKAGIGRIFHPPGSARTISGII